MHYANGRPVQKGDEAVGMDANGRSIGGVVCDLHEGEEIRNIGIIPLAGGYIAQCTSRYCLHLDDVQKAGIAMAEKAANNAQKEKESDG